VREHYIYLYIDIYLYLYILIFYRDDYSIFVDESMQPWVGPHWRQDSLIHQREWIHHLSATRHLDVWVMTSWTKIWSCTGLRIGSVVAPTSNHAAAIKRKQVPWSLNSCALAFISAVVKDDRYMQETWRVTPQWRANLVAALASHFPSWTVYGKPYLSWVWIDTHSVDVAAEATRLAKAHGCPIRSGAPGYNLPTFIRVAVRKETQTLMLMHAWASLCEETE
jgi:histidinol-phosphate/aromatic aminotransferase/cobyric acid decarboxylase-like protein